MATRNISLDLPEVPDYQPQITEVRERLARLEATIDAAPAAAAESRSLVSALQEELTAVRERLAQLESAAARVPAQVESASQETAEEVHDLPPPPPPPEQPPPAEPEPVQNSPSPAHRPWWNPLRWILG